MRNIKFGTEGWRGVIADEFTFENVILVSKAVAGYLKEKGFSTVAVAYDRRFLSDKFAETSARVLAENGINVVLSQSSAPTPAASLYAREHNLGGSVVITASHNPYYYNGFKFKPHYGGTATDDIVAEIVKHLESTEVSSTAFGGASARAEIEKMDIVTPHLEKVASLVEKEALKEAARVLKSSVIFDSMHGATASLFRKVVKEVLDIRELKVMEIRENEDPLFERGAPEPIPKFMKPLSEAVLKEEAKVGLTCDGDGDRFAAVMEDGTPLTTHELFPILLLHIIKQKTPDYLEKGLNRVVKTVSSPMYVDFIAQENSLEVLTVPVGFKFITEQFLKGGVLMGGEESGGLGYHFYIPERDGLLSNLLLLEAIGSEGKTLKQLLEQLWKDYGRYDYGRIDMHLRKRFDKKAFYEALEELNVEEVQAGDFLFKVDRIDKTDGVKFFFTDRKGWILFRASGTEPLVRVYSETLNGEGLKELLEWGMKLVKKLTN